MVWKSMFFTFICFPSCEMKFSFKRHEMMAKETGRTLVSSLSSDVFSFLVSPQTSTLNVLLLLISDHSLCLLFSSSCSPECIDFHFSHFAVFTDDSINKTVDVIIRTISTISWIDEEAEIGAKQSIRLTIGTERKNIYDDDDVNEWTFGSLDRFWTWKQQQYVAAQKHD